MAEETPQQKLAREQAEQTNVVGDHDWPRDAFGMPLVKISASAAELVPTVQYGNVTVGPVVVTRFCQGSTIEQIKAATAETQKIVEEAVASDRETVHALMRSRAAG